MQTNKQRIAALENKIEKARQIESSAKLEAAFRLAFEWFKANGQRLDLQPRADMNKFEQDALSEIQSVCAWLEDNY